jgi:hypothetical protein
MPDLPLSTSAAGTASPNAALPTDSGINSPQLNPRTLKPKNRAISDVSHIFTIVGNLEMARRSQNEKNGRIQAKLNSERPYDENSLKSEGLGYKSNFSTKPLSTTIGKVASRLTKSIQAPRYLTSAELPDSYPDAKKKTELFRREFTNLVRRWSGWYNFANQVMTEDSTFGWVALAWLDEKTWRPTFFRQDQSFFPDGTKQSVDSVQFAAFRQFVMPHELAAFIFDKDAAETAGWDISNTVESINNARPPSIPSTNAAPYTDARRYEDAIRESSVSLSLIGGAKQIMLWHVFATEIDGKVSHYIADGNSQKLLYEKLDRYPSIDDAIALMSYEQCDTLMGSKGIGREVYELAGILDRARNEAVDRLQMSGKIIVQGPENKLQRFKLTVIGNVALIPDGFQLQQTKIEAGTTEFLALEQQLVQLLDQIAGGVTPRQFGGERVTKAEVELFAAREEEKRDDITTRAITQAAGFITTMQRRAFSADVLEADARAVREKLLQYMSVEELDELRTQPALRTIEDYTQTDAQKAVLLAQESRNDPLYNHREMEKRKLSVLMDPDFAEAVLLPENDPTITAEQAREQLQENLLLSNGTEVPVSPRDNHLIHVEVLKQGFGSIAQAIGQGDPQALQLAPIWLGHWEAHVQFILQSGDKAAAQPLVKELQEVAKMVGEAQAQAQVQQEQQAAQQAQLQQAVLGGAAPAPVDPAAAPQLAAEPSPALAPAPAAPLA